MVIKKVSVIVSVYNEEAVLAQFYNSILPILQACGRDYEIIFTNDGSKDASSEILDRFASESPKVKVLHFSRNYGHEAAMIAGLDYSTGDVMICMDADLQHPVACINDIIQRCEEGYDVVVMVRTENKNNPVWKKLSSGLFYKILNAISDTHFSENASDFFAVTKQPAKILRERFRESNRFLRGYVQSIGFQSISIEYAAHDRAAGESKYNFKKLWNFSIHALTSFSNFPLRIASFCGVVSGLFCLVMIIYTIVSRILTDTPSGYATIVIIMSCMFMVMFFVLGIMGEYLGIILSEIRKRPIYIISKTANIDVEECDD